MVGRYDHAGRKVMIAVLGPMGVGYQCPVCGQPHCYLDHCIRCGQPIVYDEEQLEKYHEKFWDIDEECYIIDKRHKGVVDCVTGKPFPSLVELRKKILEEENAIHDK